MSTSSSAVRLPVVPTAPSERSTRELQLLWFALQRYPWRTLAVVPVDAVTPAWRFGERLASVAAGLGVRVRLVDARREASTRPDGAAATGVSESEPVRTIAVVDPPEEHPAGLAVISAADAVALCLSLGTTRLSDAERILALCGRERTVGAIALDDRAAP